MRLFTKQKGLADWAFIAIILGGVALIGSLAPKVTKVDDGPIEQMAEKVIYDTTGQQVDFSADVVKDQYGNVVEKHIELHKPAGAPVVTTPAPVVQKKVVRQAHGDGKVEFPVTYNK